MIAFPQNNKSMYMERISRHRAADELIRGTGWDGHRGCAIGCTLEYYDHKRASAELGIPEQLLRLEDWLFEHLPSGHLDWPGRFLGTIREGADLSGVWPAWCVRMLSRRLDDIGEGDEPWRVACRDAVSGVIAAYRDGGDLVAAAARAAEAWAAWAASAAAARTAAVAAADLAAASAAAWAAWAAGSDAEITRMADDLIELLEECK